MRSGMKRAVFILNSQRRPPEEGKQLLRKISDEVRDETPSQRPARDSRIQQNSAEFNNQPEASQRTMPPSSAKAGVFPPRKIPGGDPLRPAPGFS